MVTSDQEVLLQELMVTSGQEVFLQELMVTSGQEVFLQEVSLQEVFVQEGLERQESDFQSRRNLEWSRLQVEVEELDKILRGATDDDGFCDAIDISFQNCSETLDSRKKELATKLRSVVQLKRELDEVPSQAELMQYTSKYDIRSSELNNQIQKKHRQTRKHYDTYNALMEIKDLMLKEISLLNSISLQFQDAITSVDGRAKLIHSLEGILEGTQKKLEKVELTMQSEEKKCDSIKKKCTTAISEQRQNSSLLKFLQGERARNERLRAQINQT
ncbi:coiled-coil domain-containing protein 93 [Dorcoceras hygrometricum]|uniref:Coiled-coil domain-containing protein 93 n=1 Tax=Dorcoceras hygrometricum TaxID=472368 RepID=A0A2Z7D2T1_9LAMI|nr:coiled-coil domain-containing protein 93 [Dorcoceras hygrometricum]